LRLVSWNVENALRCLPALPVIVEHLGSRDVLCVQELHSRERDAQALAASHPRLRTEEPHARARAALAARMVDEGSVDIGRERHPGTRARTRSAEMLDRLPWSDHAPAAVEL
jgi:exonuclease III